MKVFGQFQKFVVSKTFIINYFWKTFKGLGVFEGIYIKIVALIDVSQKFT